jgi:hypothetical protein
MKTRIARIRRQRGVAALELALILPIFLILLSLPLYFGRIFWHYTVAQKAAHDAARYLSSVPLKEMKDPTKINAELALAADIIQAEVGELNPGPYKPAVTILCNNITCSGFTTPVTIRVDVELYMVDIFFSTYTSMILGYESFPLTAEVVMPYTGS